MTTGTKTVADSSMIVPSKKLSENPTITDATTAQAANTPRIPPEGMKISRKINNQSLKKQRKGQHKEEKEFKDPQLYDLDIKHNSQLQILFLNPLGNFDLSLVIPGFEQTDFVAFKANNDEDMKIC